MPELVTAEAPLTQASDGHTRCLINPSGSHAAKAQPATSSVPRPVPASAATDPWIGRTIKDYVIEGFLGAGGMGRVYAAHHRFLEMRVAIKILKEEQYDEVGIARFRREALAVARLNHPNIVRATDGGVEGTSLYLVMEHVQGVSMATLALSHQSLSVADVCEIICQAASALQHAHEHGLVHRDVKPSNLMLSATGQVKLLDLGLARFAQGQHSLTETGLVMGSLDFMSPEQAGDSRNVDIRSDIYSLGCTLYCLLTGVPPFHGPAFESPMSKLVAHNDSDPPAVHLRRRQCPSGVLKVLARMMAKDRAERYQNPVEVATALKPFSTRANLAALAQQFGNGAPLATFPLPVATEPQPDWVDFIYDGIWLVVRTLLLAVGILERRSLPTSPLSIAKPKMTYGISPKGLANAIVIGAVVLYLYLSGFRIYFTP